MSIIKEKIILIGGGGHCRSCIDVIEAQDKYEIYGIIDKKECLNKKAFGYKVIGSDEDLIDISKDFQYFFITVGQIKSPAIRIRLYNKIKSLNAVLPVIISPNAYVSKYSKIGDGTIIMHHAVVNSNTVIGKNCIINTKALIEHDSIIGDNCHISTGAVINGTVKIENNCFFGSNSVTRHNITIGSNSIISAGIRVMRDVDSKSVVMRDRL